MSPLEEYIAIIHLRQQNPLPKDEYKEEHHIIPQSLGGCNKKWNKVNLTPEEHYMAHYWLTFIYATGEAHGSMVYAWNWMSNRIKGEFISAEEYGRLKREFAKLSSKVHKGKTGPNKGKKIGPESDETKRRKSESAKGKPKPWLKGRIPWNKGSEHSEETRRKISNRNKGKRAWNTGMKMGPNPRKGQKMSEQARRNVAEGQRRRRERERREKLVG